MKILIVTGIYPPEIGGPAEYARNLKEVWVNRGDYVSLKVFSKFKNIPLGIRHIIFFFYIIPSVVTADYIFTLDAFSAGVVTVAAKLFNKKVIFRTGGDVLWELYVERTGDMVLLKDFYKTRLHKLSTKEKLIFSLMKWALQNMSAVIWSTKWKKDIFLQPYGLQKQNHFVIDNYYGPKDYGVDTKEKIFIASGRSHKLKNIDLLIQVFQDEKIKESGVILDTQTVPPSEFFEKIKGSYAVISVSLSEISPNTIISAISAGKPFIVTEENGLKDRIGDVSIVINPLDIEDIKQKVLWLASPINYESQKRKLDSFNFVHSWESIAEEYITVYNSIK